MGKVGEAVTFARADSFFVELPDKQRFSPYVVKSLPDGKVLLEQPVRGNGPLLSCAVAAQAVPEIRVTFCGPMLKPLRVLHVTYERAEPSPLRLDGGDPDTAVERVYLVNPKYRDLGPVPATAPQPAPEPLPEAG